MRSEKLLARLRKSSSCNERYRACFKLRFQRVVFHSQHTRQLS
eukprot:SAG11_NODE_9164_length_936_cov_1.485066_1_plen_42_part_10